MNNDAPPPDAEHHPRDDRYWGFWPTVGFGLAVAAAYLFVSVLVGIVFVLVVLLSDRNISLSGVMNTFNNRLGFFTSIAEVATAVSCVGLIVVFIRAKKSISVAEYLGLRRVSWKTFLIGLGVAVAVLALSALTGILLKRPQSQFDINLYKTSLVPPLLWVALIVFAPLFEETLFRGFLFEGFLHSRAGTVFTIVVTALIWSSLHLQYDLFDIANIFVFGLVLGVVRLRTGSLWNTLAMHALWNLVATVQIAISLAPK